MRINTTGYIGLIIGLLTLIWYLNFGPGLQPSQAQEKKEEAAAKKFTPTEQIGVEQAVDFPVDI